MLRTTTAVAGAALALALGACGKDDNDAGGAADKTGGTVSTSPSSTTTTTAKGTKTTKTTATKTTKSKPPKVSTVKPSATDIIAVAIEDIKFAPHDVVARVGQTVRWTNFDKVGHNVVATKGAGFESELLDQKDTYKYRTTKVGKIDYVCTIHSGQDGTIEVRK